MPNRNKRMNDAWNSMRANSDSPLNQTSSVDWVEDYKRQQRREKTQGDSPLEQRLPHEKKIKLSSWERGKKPNFTKVWNLLKVLELKQVHTPEKM